MPLDRLDAAQLASAKAAPAARSYRFHQTKNTKPNHAVFLRQISDPHLAQYAYLIGCQRTGEAIVIGPRAQYRPLPRTAA